MYAKSIRPGWSVYAEKIRQRIVVQWRHKFNLLYKNVSSAKKNIDRINHNDSYKHAKRERVILIREWERSKMLKNGYNIDNTPIYIRLKIY